jgi:hypothetical protein
MSAPLLARQDALGRHERLEDPDRETGAADLAIRVAATASVLAVAAIAAYVSYWHAYTLVSAASGTGLLAHLEPFTVDGLVCASSMVTLYAARHQLREPRLTRWTLAIGIAASLAANGAQGHSGGAAGRVVVASWPALSLVLSYEQLQWIVRSARQRGPSTQDGDQFERLRVPVADGGGEDAVDLGAIGSLRDKYETDMDATAVAVYQFSLKTGNALSERKLAEMFGKTSRRWARSRIADAHTTVAPPAGMPEQAGEPGRAAAVISVPAPERSTGRTALPVRSQSDPAGHQRDHLAANGHGSAGEVMSR